MNPFPTFGILAMAVVLLAPGALADGHDDENGGISDAAVFGLCKAYEANSKGREASGASNGNGSEEGDVESSPAFAFLESRAAAENQTTEEYCAAQTPPGAPDGLPGGPDDVPGAPDHPGIPEHPGAPDQPGVPDGTPTGPPSGTPDGPPSDTPDGPDDRPPRG